MHSWATIPFMDALRERVNRQSQGHFDYITLGRAVKRKGKEVLRENKSYYYLGRYLDDSTRKED